jgi:DNA (cytosine-5)-methyltransferase 1
MNKHHAAEFFAGIGLVRMALERAGWSVRLANDIDEKKAQLYRANFPGDHFRLGDIRQIQADDVPDVRLATASFPCIDLSLAGNRDGLAGQHSSAYWEFHRIVEAMGERRPEFVLLENVLGLLSSGGGDDLRSIIASLNKMGYVCDLLAVDAVHFVPQSRPRLFVVGLRGQRLSDPVPHAARPPQVLDFMRAHADLKWSGLALPPLPAKRRDLDAIMERLSPSAPEWWDRARQAHLYSQMSPRHRALLRH